MIWMIPVLEAVATVLATVLIKTVKDWSKKEEALKKPPPCIESKKITKRKSTQQRNRSR